MEHCLRFKMCSNTYQVHTKQIRETPNVMYLFFRRLVWLVNIRTYNSLCLWKWSEFVEIASGKLQIADVQIKEMRCVSTFVFACNPFSLLINIKLITQWSFNLLHTLYISLVCYNVITKTTCLILQRSKHFYFHAQKRTLSEWSRLLLRFIHIRESFGYNYNTLYLLYFKHLNTCLYV